MENKRKQRERIKTAIESLPPLLALLFAAAIVAHWYFATYPHQWQRVLLLLSGDSAVPPPRAASPSDENGQGSTTTAPRPAHGRWEMDPSRCLAQTGRERAALAPVYRWIDADGRVHYADAPPRGEGTDVKRIVQNDVPPVEVAVRAMGLHLPLHAQSRAIADAVGIGKVLSDVLGVDTGGGLRVEVLLVAGDADFRRLTGTDGGFAGVYQPARRRIVVQQQLNEERTLAVMRHEISHALIHEWVGRLPTALNEGLAEYFEAYEVRGLGGHVDVGRFASRLKAALPTQEVSIALHQLLSIDGEQFYGHRSDVHYSRALALVTTLMDSEEGRTFMSELLAAQRRQACVPINAQEMVARRWRGGLDGLALAWAQSSTAMRRFHSF